MGNSIKKQYLLGWEVTLDGEEHCQSFIETQITDENTAKNIGDYIELSFGDDDFLKDARLFSDGEPETEGFLFENLGVKNAVGKFRYRALSEHIICAFERDENGLHNIGGEVPSDFIIPENKCPGSFQYLGKISSQDKFMDWLPLDINLICPIYLDIDKVWIDYSNANAPQIINKDEIEATGSAYYALKSDSFIFFNQCQFKLKEVEAFSFEIGFSGIPSWIQYPDIPKCPITNRTMRFLCQLSSDLGVMVKRTNIDYTIDGFSTKYFEELNFWCDGDLFVFFEPESKIACYFIQNT